MRKYFKKPSALRGDRSSLGLPLEVRWEQRISRSPDDEVIFFFFFFLNAQLLFILNCVSVFRPLYYFSNLNSA